MTGRCAMLQGSMTDALRIGRRDVRFTHPDKVLFPRARLTKLDLARHYERVAPVMLPYVKDHPLALQSYPGGIEGKGFFVKAVPDYFPDWVQRVTVPKRGGDASRTRWPPTRPRWCTWRART